MLYSHSVLDDKLADVVEFRRMVGSKIGGAAGTLGDASSEESRSNDGGSLGRGVEEIKLRQSGMRRLVKSLNLWAIWGGGLMDSLRNHIGARKVEAVEEL